MAIYFYFAFQNNYTTKAFKIPHFWRGVGTGTQMCAGKGNFRDFLHFPVSTFLTQNAAPVKQVAENAEWYISQINKQPPAQSVTRDLILKLKKGNKYSICTLLCFGCLFPFSS